MKQRLLEGGYSGSPVYGALLLAGWFTVRRSNGCAPAMAYAPSVRIVLKTISVTTMLTSPKKRDMVAA